MKSPKLKKPTLCKNIIYVLIVLPFLLSVTIIPNLQFISEDVRVIVTFAIVIFILIYVLKNYTVLLFMSTALEVLALHNSARKQFVLPKGFSVKKVERKIETFGKTVKSVVVPSPENFRGKFCRSWNNASGGTEKFILTYYTDFLNKEEYLRIVDAAKRNVESVKTKDFDKKRPIIVVTVVVIYAKQICKDFKAELFDFICKKGDLGLESAFCPCVVDLEQGVCTFDSENLINMGFQHPARNSGIKLIKKNLFNNKLTYKESTDMLEPIEDFDPEQSLWSFWKETKKELLLDAKETKKRFEKMKHKDIQLEQENLYVKWNERGCMVTVEFDYDLKSAEIILPDLWEYPKANKISKNNLSEIRKLSEDYIVKLGYKVDVFSGDE